MISNSRFRIIATIYFIGLAILLAYTVLSFLSPAGLQHPIEAYNMHNACAQSPNFDPNCFKQVINYDFTFFYSYQVLGDYYSKIASTAFQKGNLILSISTFVQSTYFKFLYFITFATVIPVLAVWLILYGYILIYDRMSDSAEKWIEGSITGIGVAIAMYVIERFFVHQANQNGFLTLSVDYPKYFIYFWVFCLSLWFAPDIFKLKADNLIAKLVLLILSIISFSILPLSFELKLIVTPFITLCFALAYHYWRKIQNTRQQILILLYAILPIGIIASLIKHWDFFTRRLFIRDYDSTYIAELSIDLIIFLLGFLFTYLEITKESNPGESANKIPHQEFSVQNSQVSKNRDTSHTDTTWLTLLTIGVIGILGYITLKDVFPRKSGKHHYNE